MHEKQETNRKQIKMSRKETKYKTKLEMDRKKNPTKKTKPSFVNKKVDPCSSITSFEDLPEDIDRRIVGERRDLNDECCSVYFG